MSWRYEEHVVVRSLQEHVPQTMAHLVFKWRKGRVQLVHLCFPHCSHLPPSLLHQVYAHSPDACSCASAADDIRYRYYTAEEARGEYSLLALRWFEETHELWLSRQGD